MSRILCPLRSSANNEAYCVEECAFFMNVNEKPSCAIKVIAEMQIKKVNSLKN